MAPINEICSSAQKPSETIGVIYLIPSQFSGEVNLGLALVPSHRGKGLAREAVSILLQWVLDEACYHRVQVSLMAGPGRDSALKLFTGLGFAHEGTRRRQVFSPFSREYKDVTCMTILDTEWSIRHYLRHTPNNRWDELLQRHQREREELLEWEAARSKLKRTQSMETVRIPNEDIATENNMDCQQDSEMLEESEVFDLEVVQKDGTHTKQNQISNDWEDWRDYSPFLVSQTGNSPGASGSNVSERWSVEGNKPEGNEKHTGGWKSEGSSSPPPPSESSVSSWWEEISQASGSSGQWDQCETSSVAESV
ncbi:hypothetical protein K439DRAFT_1635193 [Ramaria rubella]|nr:hypothetical protein K439DRAFT_1635193 [Ramaria rubella]